MEWNEYIGELSRCTARYLWLKSQAASSLAAIAWRVKEATAFGVGQVDEAVDAAMAKTPGFEPTKVMMKIAGEEED